MTKMVCRIALLATFAALASMGCSMQAGEESELEASQSALMPAPESPPEVDPSDPIARGTKVVIPSNCTPTGGHDPYSGEPSYHCKQKDGTLKLCSWSDIRDKVSGCTAIRHLPSDLPVVDPGGLQ